MKFLKWAALILLLAAIVAVVISYIRRDSLARSIANSIIEEQGVVITDLSVDALGTDRIELSELILEQESGTVYEFHDLSFPLSFPSLRPERILIERLDILFPEEPEPSPYTDALRVVLELPDKLPNTEVTVGTISLPNVPELKEVAWATYPDGQSLALTLEHLNIFVEIDRVDELRHRMIAEASDEALATELVVAQIDDALGIDGTASVSVSPWVPILQPLNILPADLTAADANLQGPIGIVLDDGEPGRLDLHAEFSVVDQARFVYRISDDTSADIRATSSSPLYAGFTYPFSEWSVSIVQAGGQLDLSGLGELPLLVQDLECHSGIRCTMLAMSEKGPVTLGTVNVANVQGSMPFAVEIGDSTTINVSENASLTLSDVATEGLSIATVHASGLSATDIVVEEETWSAAAGQWEMAFNEISTGEEFVFSLPVTLDQIRIEDSGQSIKTGISLPLLAAEGEISYEVPAGKGSLSLRDAFLDFDTFSLSDRVIAWPHAWDFVGGSIDSTLEVDWQVGDSGANYDAAITLRMQNLAGTFNDIGFAGLDMDLGMQVGSGSAITVPSTTLDVALLDVGIPLEQVSAGFAFDGPGRRMQVDSLDGLLLGGQFNVDPFQFALDADSNQVSVSLQSIQLQFMVDLAEFEDLEMSGTISGKLPVTIRGPSATIAGGWLESDPPGGVIRYGEPVTPEEVAAMDFGVNYVIRMLSHFQFDSLTSDVEYTEAGDLKLQMKLNGINPDIDATQPIILNLGVENNIPQLLRSLQAIRSIEDILERETGN